MGRRAGDPQRSPRRASARSPKRSRRQASRPVRVPGSSSSHSSPSPGSSTSSIWIAILTDNRLLSEGLERIIAAEPSFRVVGKADVASSPPFPAGEPPDILLADARVERTLSLCAELSPGDARPWVIVLGAEGEDEWALKALQAGARGILAKDAGAQDLTKAIRAVHDGQIWTRRKVLSRLVEQLHTLSSTAQGSGPSAGGRLSAREQEITRHVAEGLSNGEIAGRLAITEATVKAHLTSIFQKLSLRGRGQLAAFYYRTSSRFAAQ